MEETTSKCRFIEEEVRGIVYRLASASDFEAVIRMYFDFYLEGKYFLKPTLYLPNFYL